MELKIKDLANLNRKDLATEAGKYLELLLIEKDPEEVLIESIRIEEFFKELNSIAKSKITSKTDYKGVTFTPTDRTTLNYSECSKWAEINAQLKERETLLKSRIKTNKDIFDSDGEEVPLVSSKTTTFITIKL